MTQPRHSARSTRRDRTRQSGAVRSPRTAHSFVSDPELFRGVIPASGLVARLRDLVASGLPKAFLWQVTSQPDHGTF